MRKWFELGGVFSALVLIAFGIGATALGLIGRHEVRQDIKREAIVGSSDMTPSAIKGEIAKAGLTGKVDAPSCDVAGEAITTGDEAKCFASYMRIHTLEATGGYTYSQMGRFEAKDGTPKSELAPGGGTDNDQWAAIDPTTKQPVANGARNIWVTETALTTALNTSFFAERVALFSIVIGLALLLTGVGFLVLVWFGAVRTGDAVHPLRGRRAASSA
jgi:hypothetical protein